MRIVFTLVMFSFFFADSLAQFKLVDSSPKNNSVSAPLNEPITLHFSDNINNAVTANSCLLNSNIRGKIDFTINISGNILTVTPSVPFKAWEEITVTLLSTLRSSADIYLSKTSFLRFTTKAGPSPSSTPLFLITLLTGTERGIISEVDLDGDGDIDIVEDSPTEIYLTNLRWLENAGAGKFTTHTIKQDVDAIKKIAPYDIDQDGDIDLLVASINQGVLLFQNDGSENFTMSSIGGSEAPVLDLDIIDFDLDGSYDVIYSLPSVGIFVLYNHGGSFENIKLTSSWAMQFKCTDIDNDGDIDILFRDDYSVSYLLNSSGIFQPTFIYQYTSGFDYINNIAVADFNNDGKLDVAIATDFSVDILLNGDSLQFSFASLTTVVDRYVRVVPADYDGDGDQDIAYADKANHFMLINNGAAIFVRANIIPGRGGFYQDNNVVTADFDNDGDLDFVVAGYQQLAIFYNATSSEAIPFTDITPSNFKLLTYADADWGDYDNDGDLDLLMIGKYNNKASTVLYENQNGVLTERATDIPGYAHGSCDWGDFDLDGDLDMLITGLNDETSSRMGIYVNTGGVFTLLSSSENQFQALNGEARWADMNNDGLLDIVLVGQYQAGIYQSTGSGNFIKKFDLLTPSDNFDVGDFDHDGDLDLVCSYPITVFRNDGNWVFASVYSNLPFGNVSWADLDNDGDLDINLTGGGQLIVFKNQNNEFFMSYQKEIPDHNVRSAPGDYNNDGYPDLLTANDDSNAPPFALSLLENDRTGNLFDSQITMPPNGSWVTTWADYDLDHDLDILAESNLVRNNTSVKNTPPTAPSLLQVDSVYDNAVYLHWAEASDKESGAQGIAYQVYAGTQSHSQDVVSSNASLSSGLRNIACQGNIKGNRTRVKINKPGTFFMGVQAIDAAFEGSAFSNEVTESVVLIQGSTATCINYVSTFSTSPSASYQWQVKGGTILSGQGTGSISVKWNASGSGNVRISKAGEVRNTLPVIVDYKNPMPVITGPSGICLSNQQYFLNDSLSYATRWSILGNGNGELAFTDAHSISVNWFKSGQQKIAAQTFSRHLGCTNYDTLTVTIFPPPQKPTIRIDKISLQSATLTSSPSPNTTYTWYFNGIQIGHGFFKELIASKSGEYNVEVFSTQNCGATSDDLIVILTDTPITGVIQTEDDLQVFPVPTDKDLFVKLTNAAIGEVGVSIYSVTGALMMKTVFQKTDSDFSTKLDLSGFSPGIYVLMIGSGTKVHRTKIIKS